MLVFFVQKLHFFSAKSTKLLQLELPYWPKCAPNSLSARALPQTPSGSLQHSARPLAAFRWPTFKGRKERGRKGRERKERKERESKEGRIGEEKERRECLSKNCKIATNAIQWIRRV